MPKKINDMSNEADGATRDGDVAVEGDGGGMVLWTRRPVCGPRTAVVDRLGELRTAGTIAAFEVETWPEEIAISEHTRHARVVETYERFRAWAETAGVSITPPFDRRTVTSLVGRTEEVLTLPVLCLAVYDDDLCGVYPCSDGDRTWTVTDYLDACERSGGRPATAGVGSVPSGR